MPLVEFAVGREKAGGEEDGGYNADDQDGGFVAAVVDGLFGWWDRLVGIENERGRGVDRTHPKCQNQRGFDTSEYASDYQS